MNNKTFRLFVSSTFMDFIEERNLLNDCVLPDLSAFCRRHGYFFQLIDLRWGIYSEAALNQRTLSICLDEVARCQQHAPRPNFLAMVGERYGWVPLPPFVPKQEMDRILAHVAEEDAQCVRKWYVRDDNEIEGRYYLRQRQGEYVDDAVWSRTERVLRDILLRGAETIGLSEADMRKYTASATEHEALLGLLSGEDALRAGVVVFRCHHPEKDADTTRIDALRQRIQTCMEESGGSDRMVWLDYADDDYRRKFVDKVRQNLMDAIRVEMARLKRLPPETFLQRLQHYYVPDMPYVENEAAVECLRNNLCNGEWVTNNSKGGRVIFVTGESGSGKSTFLSKFIQENSFVTYSFAFYGDNEQSFDLVSALRSIIRQIVARYHLKGLSSLSPTNMAEQFATALWSIPKDKRHVVVIDGLDMFAESGTWGQNVLPVELPFNVDIVVSSADPDFTRRMAHHNAHFVTLGSVAADQGEECLADYLGRNRRIIRNDRQKVALRRVLTDRCTPLHIKLLADIAADWTSDMDPVEVPSTALDAAEYYIARTYTGGEHDRELALYAMALLTVSGVGLSESELLDILYMIPSVRKKFRDESKHDFAMTHMPFAVWSRLYFDLHHCLRMGVYQGESIVQFSHAVFARAIRHYHPDVCLAATQYLIQYCQAHIEHYRLSRILLNLLAAEGKYDAMAALLGDVSFVDRYVRAGGLAHAIRLMAEIVSHTDAAVHDATKRNLICLYRHNDTLQYHPDMFLTYACESGLCEGTPALMRLASADTQDLPAPYGEGAHVVWNRDASRYLVYTHYQVHVCDGRTGIEQSSISVAAMLGERREIQAAVWVEDHILLVPNCSCSVYVFSFHDGMPVLTKAVDGDNEYGVVGYDAQYRTILTMDSMTVFLTSVDTMETTTFEPNSHFAAACYREDLHQLTLYLKSKPHYELYDLMPDGTMVHRCDVPCKHGAYPNEYHPVYAVLQDAYLHLPNEYDPVYALWRPTLRRHEYLNPPAQNRIRRMLVGDRTLLLVYAEGMLAVALDSMQTTFYRRQDVVDIAWHTRDKVLSVLTHDRAFFLVSLDAFAPEEPIPCTKHNLYNHTWKGLLGGVVTILHTIQQEHKRYAFLSYGDVFAYGLESDKAGLLGKMVPTLVVRADTGLLAVAYEYADTIVISDDGHRPLFVVDRLQLGMDNNLLKLVFSANGRYLTVWTNRFLQVFSLEACRCILACTLRDRPLRDLWYEGNDLHLSLFGEEAVYRLSSRGANAIRALPRFAAAEGDCYDYPYYTLPAKPENVYALFDLEHAEFYPTRDYESNTGSVVADWIVPTRHYASPHHTLSYHEGAFYLELDENKRFASDLPINYAACVQRQLALRESEMTMYVDRKNDLFSRLYEPREDCLLLASRMLNALVLFDLSAMRIAVVYPIEGHMLGVTMTDDTHVTVYVDGIDNPIQILLTLPPRQ